jgi:cytochrome c
MENRFNTIAGWVLGSGVVALALSSLSYRYFEAGKTHAPEKPGYAVEGGEGEGGGAKAEVPFETLLASADVAKGEATFKKCMSCHTINAGGADGIGPHLHGVVGRAIGSTGFAYSDALKAKGGTWDFASLNEWLHNPKKFAEGNKMSFPGLPDAAERANLIVYLNSQGSNLPLPAAPAAPAAGAEGAAPETAALVGDAAAGEKSFAKCKACHTIDAGRRQRRRAEPGWRLWRSDRHGPRRVRLLRCAEGQGRQVGRRRARRLADQAQRLRSRHQDELRRQQQPAGTRQPDRLHEDQVRRRGDSPNSKRRGRMAPPFLFSA